ncbi:MAG: hypothetical protein ACI9RM_002512 [Ulvibacter sp.]|jgi:hypothetical protein
MASVSKQFTALSILSLVDTSIDDDYRYDNALKKHSIVSEEMHKLVFKPNSISFLETKFHFSFLNKAEERYAMGWLVTEKIASTITKKTSTTIK